MRQGMKRAVDQLAQASATHLARGALIEDLKKQIGDLGKALAKKVELIKKLRAELKK